MVHGTYQNFVQILVQLFLVYVPWGLHNLLEEVGHPVQPNVDPFSSGNSSRVCGNSGGFSLFSQGNRVKDQLNFEQPGLSSTHQST